jgi:hypothetical protein
MLIAFCCVSIFTACDQSNKQKNPKSASDKASANSKKEALFKKIAPSESGIDFINRLNETPELNIINYHYFYNGGGVAAGDLNNDGLIDLYFTSNQEADKLYINQGNLKFEDQSDKLPPKAENSWSTGVLMADLNGDGLLDIYLSMSGRLPEAQRKNRLLINYGDLNFKEEADAYGLADAAYSTQAAVLDYDQDGDLDLFLLNHEIDDISNYNKEVRANQRDQYVGDKLYRNDGTKFTDVSQSAGIDQNPYGFGLGVAISDLNNDSWPDIYVSNDFTENDYLYINQGNGKFKNQITSATKHNSNYGMGVDAADINNDALSDIMVVDMVAKDNYRQKTNMSGMNPEQFWKTIAFGFHYQYMYNTLHLNQGGEKFSDIAQMAGVSNTDWSWSPLMVDFDLDGNKDIFVSNGLRKDVRNNDFVKKHVLYADQMPKNKGLDSLQILQNQLFNMPSQRIANVAFQNKGDLNIEEVGKQWGLTDKAFSTGAIYADLDNDGDQDLIMNNVDDTAFVYENKAKNKQYLSIKLKGTDKNPYAIGSKLILHESDRIQSLEYYPSRGFQSSTSTNPVFAVQRQDKVKLEVIWPNGSSSITEIDQFDLPIELSMNELALQEWKTESVVPIVRNISKMHGISHNHYENAYDDFQDQVLLPHQLSNLGPALAVGDVNDDGLDDFFIGSAVGYYPALYVQNQQGKFEIQKSNPFEKEFSKEEMSAVFFDSDGDGDQDLYIGYGSYEFDANSLLLQDALFLNDGKGNFSKSNRLPKMKNSTSVVLPFDYDNDGDLDLFVGSRMQQKRYPLPPSSYLLENQGETFVDVTEEKASALKRMGMVTTAIEMDENGDGRKDLIIAGEWMKIKILHNLPEGFLLKSDSLSDLKKSGGWWYALASDDVNKDGTLDLIGGNLGLNYKYKASKEEPFKVFSNDFDNNQTVDIVLSYPQKGTYYPLRGRECSSQQLPSLKKKFPSYNEFATASVYDVIGRDQAEYAYERNAHTFANAVYLNDGMTYKEIPFHNESQISSINSILLKDVNNDGYNDLIMGGNLYSAEVETPRNDASYGHILINNQDGTYSAISTERTAFFGEGEIRAIRSIRIKGKENTFLVAQNNGYLKLYQLINQEL